MINISSAVTDLLHTFSDHVGVPCQDVAVFGDSPFNIDVRFTLSGRGAFVLRALQAEDTPLLIEFGEGLSDRSKDFFGPYPWVDKTALEAAFQSTIARAISCSDAMYLLFCNDKPIAHFFMWKTNEQAPSRAHGVAVPELGIAIADDYHGQGYGHLAMRFLQLMAEYLAQDAIELTTAISNIPGQRTYASAGYTTVGTVPIPLLSKPGQYREEYQMVLPLNPLATPNVMAFLQEQRTQLWEQELMRGGVAEQQDEGEAGS